MTLERVARIRPLSALRNLLRNEAAGGLLLMAAAASALVVANSPLSDRYFAVKASYLGPLTVDYWINDGLMAIFFLVVGLEIKRELIDGGLRTWGRRVLPGIAALAGMIVPALIYIAVNRDSPETLRGWAIPAATDIAFALGILALVGRHVPVSLKVFLTAVAILDDIGAIAIIAVAYTDALAVWPLAGAAVSLAGLVAMNLRGVTRLWPYLLLGGVLWVCVLGSGVHATLAGVALALTIPLKPTRGCPDDPTSPLHRLEHLLHPWVAFAIVPLFGFANAGVSFAGVAPATLLEPLPLGIVLGLAVGKQLGIFASVWVAVRLNWADLPANAGWRQMYGVAILCGVGFTMSLFIGGLAFDDAERAGEVRIGVLAGSFISALAAAALLASPKTRRPARQ